MRGAVMASMTVPTTPANITLSAPLTEAGAAERFAHQYGHLWRYDHRRRCWLRWSGDYWNADTDGAMRPASTTAAI